MILRGRGRFTLASPLIKLLPNLVRALTANSGQRPDPGYRIRNFE